MVNPSWQERWEQFSQQAQIALHSFEDRSRVFRRIWKFWPNQLRDKW
jgi:hypothetical protein